MLFQPILVVLKNTIYPYLIGTCTAWIEQTIKLIIVLNVKLPSGVQALAKKRSISNIAFIPYFRLINVKVPPAESHIPLKNRSPKRKGFISKDPLLLYWVSMQKSGGHKVEMWHCPFALSFFLRTHPLLSLNKGRGGRCRCPGLHQCSLTFPA